MNVTEDLNVPCPLCNRTTHRSEPCHRVCLLRGVMGGIGHFIDHRFWCLVVQDPDAEMGRFESACCVDALVGLYGVEAVMAGDYPTVTLEEVRALAGLA